MAINFEDIIDKPEEADLTQPSLGDMVKLPKPEIKGDNKEVTIDELEESSARRLHEVTRAEKDVLYGAIHKDPTITYDKFIEENPSAMGVNKAHFNYAKNHPNEWVPGAGSPAKAAASGANVAPQKVFNPDEASDELKKMMDLLAKEQAEIQGVEEQVASKFNTMYDIAYLVASGRSQKKHLFICGDPGIGKSYEVVQAVKAGLSKRKNKLQYMENSGSVGRSLSNLLAYFYPKRDGFFILLDDADDFLTSTDQLIKNFFKAMMDPDGHAISSPAGYRKLANKLIAAEANDAALGESTTIEINKEALREGYIDILVNGQQIGDGQQHLEEATKLSKLMRLRETTLYAKPKTLFDKFGRRLYENEETGEPDDEELDDDLFAIAHDEDEEGEGGEKSTLSSDPIPAKFMFTSCICIISNLYMDQVEEAIKSRTDKFEITLNNDEFMCRLGGILPKLKKGVASDLSDAEWDWVKKECYAMLALAVEADKLGAPLAGSPFVISVKLQFRIIAELGDLFITVADRYAASCGETNKTKIANAIRTKFIKYHLIPALAGQRVRKGRK